MKTAKKATYKKPKIVSRSHAQDEWEKEREFIEEQQQHLVEEESYVSRAEKLANESFQAAAAVASLKLRGLVIEAFHETRKLIPELEGLEGEPMGVTLFKFGGRFTELSSHQIRHCSWADDPESKEKPPPGHISKEAEEQLARLRTLLTVIGDWRAAYTLYDVVTLEDEKKAYP